MLLGLFGSPEKDTPSKLAIGSFGGFDVAYRKDTADENVIDHSLVDERFFSAVPEYRPEDGHVIVDIGAHIGPFVLLASSKVGSVGKVYAIEASEESFNYLRINVALNGCENISAHHLALADREGSVTLHHAPTNWGHSTVNERTDSGETVPCTTLATFFEQNGIERCHFMKLNCEGAEFPILLGSDRSVLQRIETMLILYHCDLWEHDTEDDLISHLESCGFECDFRRRSKKRGWIVATSQSG